MCSGETKNYVFIGESGSGKTELSINLAQWLAKTSGRRVCLFDMDQTKGLFRARDFKEELTTSNVELMDTVSFLDSPVVPAGVTGVLEDPDTVCVFDVGGNAVGAKMIGQYRQQFRNAPTRVFYIINPYRPFSGEMEFILTGMEYILSAARISPETVEIISNPCLGAKTTAQRILEGHRWLSARLQEHGQRPLVLAVDRQFAAQVQENTTDRVIPINLFVKKLYQI